MLEPSNGQLEAQAGYASSDALVPIGPAASQVGATVRRLRYAIRSGEVKGARVFGRYAIFASEIERLRNQKPPPPASVRP
jgi:hypothetical protein